MKLVKIHLENVIKSKMINKNYICAFFQFRYECLLSLIKENKSALIGQKVKLLFDK